MLYYRHHHHRHHCRILLSCNGMIHHLRVHVQYQVGMYLSPSPSPRFVARKGTGAGTTTAASAAGGAGVGGGTGVYSFPSPVAPAAMASASITMPSLSIINGSTVETMAAANGLIGAAAAASAAGGGGGGLFGGAEYDAEMANSADFHLPDAHALVTGAADVTGRRCISLVEQPPSASAADDLSADDSDAEIFPLLSKGEWLLCHRDHIVHVT